MPAPASSRHDLQARGVVLAVVLAVMLVAALMIRTRFEADPAVAAERAAQGSVAVTTRCGPPEAQADGHICLLDALHIARDALIRHVLATASEPTRRHGTPPA